MKTPYRLARSTQRGAALLLAMLIVTLVASLAAGMVWQQWRAIEVESAQRARSQASWLIEGTTDWARLILREDARGGGGKPNVDSPDESWGIPLRDVKLSDFLAADRNNTLESLGTDVSLSGQITDVQGRYNLHNLLAEEEAAFLAQLKVWQRLCQLLGVPADTATQVVQALRGSEGDAAGATGEALLPPSRLEQLSWLKIDAETLKKLRPHVVILPGPTTVNLNSSTAEVLAATTEGLDRGTAERILRARPPGGYENIDALQKQLPEKIKLNAQIVGVSSTYFEIDGELRYDQYVLRERSLVHRQGLEVQVVRRERLPPE